MYIARVAGIMPDGKFSLAYYDGEVEEVESAQVVPLARVGRGTRVIVNWRDQGRPYGGTIVRFSSNGTLEIAYDDGTQGGAPFRQLKIPLDALSVDPNPSVEAPRRDLVQLEQQYRANLCVQLTTTAELERRAVAEGCRRQESFPYDDLVHIAQTASIADLVRVFGVLPERYWTTTFRCTGYDFQFDANANGKVFKLSVHLPPTDPTGDGLERAAPVVLGDLAKEMRQAMVGEVRGFLADPKDLFASFDHPEAGVTLSVSPHQTQAALSDALVADGLVKLVSGEYFGEHAGWTWVGLAGRRTALP